MGHIVTTIIPIFILVILGTIARSKGFLPAIFLDPANPVIISAIVGIFYSMADSPMPLAIDRSLQILSGLTLPMALLIIGGSLSLKPMKAHWAGVMDTCLLILLILPALWGLPCFVRPGGPLTTIGRL